MTMGLFDTPIDPRRPCAACGTLTGIRVGNGLDWLPCCLDPACEPLVRSKLKRNIITITTEQV